MELVLPELLRELHHHRRDSFGGGRPRGPPPGRHPLLSLLSQGEEHFVTIFNINTNIEIIPCIIILKMINTTALIYLIFSNKRIC